MATRLDSADDTTLAVDQAPAGAEARDDTDGVVTPSPRTTRRQRSKVRRFLRSRWLGVLFIVALLALWELLTTSGVVNTPNLPPISTIFERWYEEIVRGTLLTQLGATLGRMVRGYALAVVIGVTLGVLMGSVRTLYGLLEPTVELIRPVPITAFIPLMILFLGIGDQMKISIITLGATFPILLASYSGVTSVPRTMVETAKTFRLGWLRTIREITIPAAAPVMFVGLRLALTTSLIIAVFAEMIAGNSGIGYFILMSQQNFDVVGLYVGIFTLAVIGYGFNLAFLLVERTLLRWHFASHARDT
jgi:ABC-type nitrate/sulfonate/bicarbonate transport system permease component